MILSVLIALPLAGLVVVLFLHKERHLRLIRGTAIAAALATFVWSIFLCMAFATEAKTGPLDMRLEYQTRWIPSLGIGYHVGVDGLSVPLIVLTTALSLLSIIYSLRITERVKEYMAWFLLLEAGMLGVFISLDFFLFYVFWEIGLVPMYFLIGVWGGPRREYAAIKFFLYTLVGSLAMLLAILACYFAMPVPTFDMIEIMQQNPMAGAGIKASLVFWAFFLGFAIKVPLWPFHTWLPDAHVEAPTAGSVILAGVLLKLGTYGFVRVVLPMFPEASAKFADYLAILALISIIYGALCAMAQSDLKKLIAYSSVNHMGYVMLGIAAAAANVVPELAPLGKTASIASRATALNGATLQMIVHGIITGALFFLVGVIYDRAHTRDINALGGLAKQMPLYSGVMMFACFASLGLPGLAGFVAEFFVFVGSFPSYTLITCLAALGVIVTAAYFLWMIQRVFLGPLKEKWADLPDMDWGEIVAITPLCVATLVIGLYPKPLIAVINGPMTEIVEHVVRLAGLG
ncbi:MAG: NADH-quinone oxidoreductase subunit M [Chloroflexi bacterium]|nr:NADH-quinone oxidoreductase subunit M [Chloroflexota bacterium]